MNYIRESFSDNWYILEKALSKVSSGHQFLNILDLCIKEDEFLCINTESILCPKGVPYKHLVSCIIQSNYLDFNLDVSCEYRVRIVLDIINSLALCNILHKIVTIYVYFDNVHIVVDGGRFSEYDIIRIEKLITKYDLKGPIVSYVGSLDLSYGPLGLASASIAESALRISQAEESCNYIDR